MNRIRSLLALLRWDLVQVARGEASQAAVTIAALASAGLVGVGVLILSIWSPFTLTPTFGSRPDPNASPLLPIIGEYRGGIAFLIVLLWLLLLATTIGPAFAVGAMVRDRRAGRLDRILLDTSRADLVALAKLLTALVPLGFTLLVAGPAASFAWLIGGVSTPDAIAAIVTLMTVVVLIASISLICSTLATTEAAGVLISYSVTAVVLLAPFVIGAILAVAGLTSAANVVVSFDPVVALLAGQPALMRSLVHLTPGVWTTMPIIWTLDVPVKIQLPVWAVDALLYAAFAAGLVWLTGVILEPLHPIKTARLGRSYASVEP